jgi:hypothetical protein
VVGIVALMLSVAGASSVWSELRSRWRRRQGDRANKIEPGSAPGVPLVPASEAELAQRLASRRCACGDQLVSDGDENLSAVLGGEVVRTRRLTCAACSNVETVYFVRRYD